MKPITLFFKLVIICFLLFIFSCKVLKQNREERAEIETQNGELFPQNGELDFQNELKQLIQENKALKNDLLERREASERDALKLEKEIPTSAGNQELPNSKKSLIIRSTTIENVDKIIYTKTNSSSVAFYCPEVMKEEVTYEVRAMLGCLIRDERTKEELLYAINETRRERKENPLTIEDIVTKEVLLGEYLKIELFDPDNKFVIKSLPDNHIKDGLVRIYDVSKKTYINESFQWIWKVTPKPKMKGEAALTFIITPYDKNKEPQTEKTRDYKIIIKLKEGFIANTWELANRHPDWALASIITPILSFFVGIFLKREKKINQVN